MRILGHLDVIATSKFPTENEHPLVSRLHQRLKLQSVTFRLGNHEPSIVRATTGDTLLQSSDGCIVILSEEDEDG